MMPGFFGRLRQLVARAVYAILNPGKAGPMATYLQRMFGRLSPAEIAQVRREARVSITTAAAATGLQPQQTLRDALGGRRPPAEAVQVKIRYQVVTESGKREWRESTHGLGTAADPQITWGTTIAEIRSRADALEARRDRPSEPGQVDWSTASFIPPLRYPPA